MILESNKNNTMCDSSYKVLMHLTVHASWVSWSTSHSSYQCMIEHGCNFIYVVLWFFSSQLSYFSDRGPSKQRMSLLSVHDWDLCGLGKDQLSIQSTHVHIPHLPERKLEIKNVNMCKLTQKQLCKNMYTVLLSKQTLCFSSVQLLWNKLQGKYIQFTIKNTNKDNDWCFILQCSTSWTDFLCSSQMQWCQ